MTSISTRRLARVLATFSIATVAVAGVATAASALPIRDTAGIPPDLVIVDPPPPTTVPPVTVPPVTVPPTTMPTPPTTVTPPPNNGGGNGTPANNGGGNSNAPANNGSVNGDDAAVPVASQSTLPALGIDTVGTDAIAASPVATKSESNRRMLVLIGAVLAAVIAGLGAGLFLRHQRQQA